MGSIDIFRQKNDSISICNAYAEWLVQNNCSKENIGQTNACNNFQYEGTLVSEDHLKIIDSFCFSHSKTAQLSKSDFFTEEPDPERSIIGRFILGAIVVALGIIYLIINKILEKGRNKKGIDSDDGNPGSGVQASESVKSNFLSRASRTIMSWFGYSEKKDTVLSVETSSSALENTAADDSQDESSADIIIYPLAVSPDKKTIADHLMRIRKNNKRRNANPNHINFFAGLAIERWNALSSKEQKNYWIRDFSRPNAFKKYTKGDLPHSFMLEFNSKVVNRTIDTLRDDPQLIFNQISDGLNAGERLSAAFLTAGIDTITKTLVEHVVNNPPDFEIVYGQIKRTRRSIAQKPEILNYLTNLAIGEWYRMQPKERTLFFDSLATFPQPGELPQAFLDSFINEINLRSTSTREELEVIAPIFNQLMEMEPRLTEKHAEKVDRLVRLAILPALRELELTNSDLIANLFGPVQDNGRLSVNFAKMARTSLLAIVTSPDIYERTRRPRTFEQLNIRGIHGGIDLRAIIQVMSEQIPELAHYPKLLEWSGKELINDWLSFPPEFINKFMGQNAVSAADLQPGDLKQIPKNFVILWLTINGGLRLQGDLLFSLLDNDNPDDNGNSGAAGGGGETIGGYYEPSSSRNASASRAGSGADSMAYWPASSERSAVATAMNFAQLGFADQSAWAGFNVFNGNFNSLRQWLFAPRFMPTGPVVAPVSVMPGR